MKVFKKVKGLIKTMHNYLSTKRPETIQNWRQMNFEYKVINTLDRFSAISRLKVNNDKTQMIWLSSMKNSHI